LYWVRHVQHSRSIKAFKEPVNDFLRQHLLHWLETLSICQKIDEGVTMVSLLESLYVSNFQ
jgi:hypothetical protein